MDTDVHIKPEAILFRAPEKVSPITPLSEAYKNARERIVNSTPLVESGISLEGKQALVWSRKDTNLPLKDIEQILTETFNIPFQERRNHCQEVNIDLVKRKVCEELFYLSQSAISVRGKTGDHYVSGVQVRPDTYLIVDPTWPLLEEPDEEMEFPSAIIVVVKNRKEALDAMEKIYGHRPHERETRLQKLIKTIKRRI